MAAENVTTATVSPARERERVRQSFASAPVVGVVRTESSETAEALARAYIAGGLELIEITFTVPHAGDLIRRLREERGQDGPPWIGAGTVTCNYDGTEKHRTTIGARSFVGSDTMLVAPVNLGEEATTAAGSVITDDVPAGALGIGRSRQRNLDGWAERRRRRQQRGDDRRGEEKS